MALPAIDDGPPVWQQYQALKRQHPDALLLFRIGDFYETFDDDAIVVARELDIVLTGREMGKGRRHPLAGIPYHALDGHLARLVTRGYRVAICEQTSEPGAGRGLVERSVVRIVTPGTIVEPTILEAKANNFIAAACWDEVAAGMAYLDVTTGEYACIQVEGGRSGGASRSTRHDRPDPAGTALDAGRGGRSGRARRPDRSDIADVARHADRAGRFDATAATPAVRRLAQELSRLGVAELLVPAADRRRGAENVPAELAAGWAITGYDAGRFSIETAADHLRAHFQVATLDGFGCGDQPLAVAAAGALLAYVAEVAPATLGHLRPLRTDNLDGLMALDAATRRNLELVGSTRGDGAHSLLAVLDRTRTAMGGRRLRRWLVEPLLDRAALDERLDRVAALAAAPRTRAALAATLAGIVDLERLVGRAVQGSATARELRVLAASLGRLPALRAALDQLAAAGHPAVAPLAAAIGAHAALAALIDRAIVPEPPPSLGEGGTIAPGYAAELDAIVEASRDAREWMATLEAREREQTGLRGLRVGYNRVFGYYLEISTAALRLEPTAEITQALAGRPAATVQEYLERQRGYLRKQTLVGAERYITPELKEKEQLVLDAQERIVALERRLVAELCQRIAAVRVELLATAETIARLDVALALADAAVEHGYVRPRLTDDAAIEIVGGRHPVVERAALAAGFVPNDARLSNDLEQVVILTGPNMAGKSTYLRQVGLIVLMAQIGSFVPADEATIGLVDRIFTRVGAQDDIAAGQSTFMVEMAETAYILNHATPRSLLILDEIGRGTATFDGMAIARAIVEHIHDYPRLGCKTLFATHYHELTGLVDRLGRVRNFRVDVLEDGDQVTFTHRVVPGGADRSYGIHVARLAGIPATVTQRARKLLRELESRRGPRPAPANGAPARGLFDPPRHPLLEELAGLDPNALTPLQALNALHGLVDRARREA